MPDYKSARVAADSLGLELVGDVVKLVAENQVVSQRRQPRGHRQGRTRPASCSPRTFTQKYAELAAKLPVFAEMRNVIDLAIAAAFIKQQDFYAKAAGRPTRSTTKGSLAVETYKTPLQVETVCTAVWKGNTLMTPVGGGVTIHPRKALCSRERAARRRRQDHRAPRSRST